MYKAATRIDNDTRTESRYKTATMQPGPNALGIPTREARVSRPAAFPNITGEPQ